jgi:hypothetical protein
MFSLHQLISNLTLTGAANSCSLAALGSENIFRLTIVLESVTAAIPAGVVGGQLAVALGARASNFNQD